MTTSSCSLPASVTPLVVIDHSSESVAFSLRCYIPAHGKLSCWCCLFPAERRSHRSSVFIRASRASVLTYGMLSALHRRYRCCRWTRLDSDCCGLDSTTAPRGRRLLARVDEARKGGIQRQGSGQKNMRIVAVRRVVYTTVAVNSADRKQSCLFFSPVFQFSTFLFPVLGFRCFVEFFVACFHQVSCIFYFRSNGFFVSLFDTVVAVFVLIFYILLSYD